MRKFLLLLLLGTVKQARAQELYVFTEPASNVPAHSISLKLIDHVVSSDNIYQRFSQRFTPQVMWGINRKWMFRGGLTFGNMHTPGYRYESFTLYGKYRFYSDDELHKHFRMAAFIEGSKTRAPFHYDEISLMGDKSGIGIGLIATQLWHKLALSGTIEHIQVLDPSRNNNVIYIPERSYQAMNYNLSAGYLLFPKEYTGYKQVNVNLYTELLIQQALDMKKHIVDIAPSAQFIFNSNTKLNFGYRFQADGNMSRMTNNSWHFSVERTFLDAVKKKAR